MYFQPHGSSPVSGHGNRSGLSNPVRNCRRILASFGSAAATWKRRVKRSGSSMAARGSSERVDFEAAHEYG